MALAIIQAPVGMPVSLADAKAHLRIETSEEDAVLTRMIEAVTSWLAGPQGWLGRSLCDQTLEWIGEPPVGPVTLPRPPFLSLVEAAYVDGPNEYPIVADLRTWIDDDGLARVEQAEGWTWWSGGVGRRVRIRYRAGYGTSADPARAVDPGIQQAILTVVGRMFEERGTDAEPYEGARDLFAPFIVWGPR